MSSRTKRRDQKKRREERLRQEHQQPAPLQPRSDEDADESETIDDEWDGGIDPDEEDEDGESEESDPGWYDEDYEYPGWYEEDDWVGEPTDEAFRLSYGDRFDAEQALRCFERDRRGTPPPDDPVERAQKLAFQALSANDCDNALRLAHEALRADPECLDAQAIVLQHAESEWPKQIVEFERMLATGSRQLGGPAFFDAHQGEFWRLVATRPYMRVRKQLAHLLAFTDRLPEALAHYEALLELDARDHLHIRAPLLCRYLELGRMEDAKRIMARFPHGRAVYLWAQALEHFLNGDLVAAARTCSHAVCADPTVVEQLNDPNDDMPGVVEPCLDLDPADVAYCSLIIAWNKHPRAMHWMENGALAFSRKKVREHQLSFGPPVSDLFDETAPDVDAWIDYPAEFSLDESDVPDLVRMATDYALQESEDVHVRFSAVHARRALAQLKAPAAIAPLLDLFADYLDEFAEDDLPRVFELLGPASLDGLRTLLGGRLSIHLRSAVAKAIRRIGCAHPDAFPACNAILLEQLQRYRENHQALNARLAMAIEKLDIESTPRVVYEAFAAGYIGDFCLPEHFAKLAED